MPRKYTTIKQVDRQVDDQSDNSDDGVTLDEHLQETYGSNVNDI